MRSHIPARVLVFAVASALGCAPALTVGSSAATDLQPSAYRTYMWETPDALPTGDPRLDNNPFFVQTLQQAADSQLAKLGLSRSSFSADLVVHFHATVRDRVNVYEVDRAAGMDQTGYPRASEAQQYEEGTVLLDMAEAKRQEADLARLDADRHQRRDWQRRGVG